MSKAKNSMYYFHIAVFLLLSFGVGFLPPFAQITEVGMRVLGIFLGLVYAWLFIAIDWPSIVAIIFLGLSGYAASVQEMFLEGWSFQVLHQVLLGFLLAEALRVTNLGNYFSEKILGFKLIQGRPYAIIAALFVLEEVLTLLCCAVAAIVVVWVLVGEIAQKAGYGKDSKFVQLMLPAVVAFNAIAGFVWPFMPNSLVCIGFFGQAMPQLPISLTSWALWNFLYMVFFTITWVAIVKFVFRFDFSALANIDNIQQNGAESSKLSKEQKLALIVLGVFAVGVFAPNFMPDTWFITQVLVKMGLTGMLSLAIIVLVVYRNSDGNSFCSLGSLAHGIPWGVIWLIIATEPVANAINSETCGIMASVMGVITPLISSMSPTLFVFVTVIAIGLTTQVVHNLILMVVFIPLLCPMYAQMGGNPFVMLLAIEIAAGLALATPAASWASALIFGHEDVIPKFAMIEGIANFALGVVLFLLIGIPMANIIF